MLSLRGRPEFKRGNLRALRIGEDASARRPMNDYYVAGSGEVITPLPPYVRRLAVSLDAVKDEIAKQTDQAVREGSVARRPQKTLAYQRRGIQARWGYVRQTRRNVIGHPALSCVGAKSSGSNGIQRPPHTEVVPPSILLRYSSVGGCRSIVDVLPP